MARFGDVFLAGRELAPASPATPIVVGVGDRPPPIGLAFVAFAAAIVGFYVMANVEPHLDLQLSTLPAGQLGLVATTVLAVAGTVSGYRAITARWRHLLPLTCGLLVPGAVWSALVFTFGFGTGSVASTVAGVVASAFGVLLLAQGFGSARWFGVFCGLGAVGMSLAASVVRGDADAAGRTFPALLVAVAGMACLYGILVEIEVSEHATRDRLLATREQIESEIVKTEDLLHDLRTGLMSIEAAMAGVDSDLAGPLRSEAARLRRLTVKNRKDSPRGFDLVASVRPLLTAREAAGTELVVRTPKAAIVRGDESEVLAIVDNLISNAERHGAPPVQVEIRLSTGEVDLSVSDGGTGLDPDDLEKVFERGVTTRSYGQGIGLARARSLAEDNAGRLTADADPEGQTRFVLTLPAERNCWKSARRLVS